MFVFKPDFCSEDMLTFYLKLVIIIFLLNYDNIHSRDAYFKSYIMFFKNYYLIMFTFIIVLNDACAISYYICERNTI